MYAVKSRREAFNEKKVRIQVKLPQILRLIFDTVLLDLNQLDMFDSRNLPASTNPIRPMKGSHMARGF